MKPSSFNEYFVWGLLLNERWIQNALQFGKKVAMSFLFLNAEKFCTLWVYDILRKFCQKVIEVMLNETFIFDECSN